MSIVSQARVNFLQNVTDYSTVLFIQIQLNESPPQSPAQPQCEKSHFVRKMQTNTDLIAVQSESHHRALISLPLYRPRTVCTEMHDSCVGMAKNCLQY